MLCVTHYKEHRGFLSEEGKGVGCGEGLEPAERALQQFCKMGVVTPWFSIYSYFVSLLLFIKIYMVGNRIISHCPLLAR